MHQFEQILPLDCDVPNLRTLYNMVIIEFNQKENEKTKGGLYAPNIKTADRVAEFANRIGKVVKVPEKLHYKRGDLQYSMRWLTDMELEVGDTVWMNHYTLNDYTFRYEDKLYKAVRYEDLHLAKRGDKIVLLNGYVLLKPIFRVIDVLDFSKQKLDKTQGIIAYMGSPIKEYASPEYISMGETVYRSEPNGFEIGDRVVINKKDVKKLRPLEYAPFAKLDGNQYIVAQRYMFAGVVKQ